MSAERCQYQAYSVFLLVPYDILGFWGFGVTIISSTHCFWLLTFQALAFARKKNANPQTPPSRACERRGRCRCRFYPPVSTVFDHFSFFFPFPAVARKQTIGNIGRTKAKTTQTTRHQHDSWEGEVFFLFFMIFPCFSSPFSPSTKTLPHRSIRPMTNASSWLPISCGRGLATPYHGRHMALFPQPNAINPD